MTALVLCAAVLCGLVLALSVAAALMLLRVNRVLERARRDGRNARALESSYVDALSHRLDALAARIEDIRAIPHASVVPQERGGINLSRRSQALRLYRRGEPAGQIAVELGIPLQEVQLLIKVHEIVMSTV